jgi:hypothetical protein
VLELLAAIQSVDPPSLVLWGLTLLAAGMYPVGFMLGSSCSACCGCEQCAAGSLPETVTVTFDNIPERVYWVDIQFSACYGSGARARVSETTGQHNAISAIEVLDGGSGYAKLGRVAPSLTITGSGTGATFTPTLQAVNDKCGVPSWKVASVAVSGGSGYTHGENLTVDVAAGDTVTTPAVLALQTVRGQPTLAASATTGSGATFTISTASNGDSPETWRVSGVTVSGSTSGYVEGEKLAFAGGTEVAAADVRIRTDLVEPTVTASVSGGSGASLAVSLTKSGDRWGVSGVGVTSGGTGYTDGDPVTFAVTDGTQETAASATIVLQRLQPTLSSLWVGRFVDAVFVQIDGGAVLTPNMTSETLDGDQFWTPSSVTITDGGEGYEVGDLITWSEPYETLSPFGDSTANPDYDPDIVRDAADSVWSVTSVDGSGAITGVEMAVAGYYYLLSGGVIESVTVTAAGSYYKSGGVIQSLELVSGGQYYGRTGTPVGVTVTNGGSYYREDASEPPYVATVTATVVDYRPNLQGGGAQVAAVVDEDTGSETFGQVTSVTIIDGGGGYEAWWYNHNCCGQFFNGRSIVLRRPRISVLGGSTHIERCIYTHSVCSNIIFGNPSNEVLVYYDGPSSPPRVRIRELTTISTVREGELFCDSLLYGDTLITDCGDMSFTATDYRGATATVTPGGNYDAEYANQDCYAKGAICCGWSSDPPEEIEVTVEDSPDGEEWGPPNGLPAVPTVVLSLTGTLGLGPIFGAINYFAHGRDVIQWKGQVPGAVNVVSQNLAVRVQACTDSCGEPPCAESCSTTIRSQTTYAGRTDSEQASSDDCSGCESIPQCAPSPIAFEFDHLTGKRRVTVL